MPSKKTKSTFLSNDSSSDQRGPSMGVLSLIREGRIWKNIWGTFWFFWRWKPWFFTTGGSINHLLKQGNFWNYAINPIFLHDFTTYSTDKHNFDQRFKFVHQMRVLRKVCLWDSNDHYTWHLVIFISKSHSPSCQTGPKLFWTTEP